MHRLLLLLLLLLLLPEILTSQLTQQQRRLVLLPISLDNEETRQASQDACLKAQTSLAKDQRIQNDSNGFELVLDNLQQLRPSRQTPRWLLKTACSVLEMQPPKRGNTLLLAATDHNTVVMNKKSLIGSVEYLLHIATSMGVPSFTYLANSVTYLGTDEKPLALRLEPGASHVAMAMADFLRTYGWTMATLVVSSRTPGHRQLAEELKKLSDESRKTNNPNVFRFEISQVISFPGLKIAGDIFRCTKSTSCKLVFRRVLEALAHKEERIFLFHGMSMDLRILVDTAQQYNHLRFLFDKEYLWLVSPTVFSSYSQSLQKGVPSQLGRTEVPGLFGFIYKSDLTRAAHLAASVWHQALVTFHNRLKAAGKLTEREVLNRLHPKFNCTEFDDGSLFWNEGAVIYRIMKNSTFCYQCHDSDLEEIIGFDQQGFINSTKFEVMNSRPVTGSSPSTSWYPVGRWSISSRNQPEISKLHMGGITWPGYANTPPIGRPKKFRLNVATLKEDPFVRYWPPEPDGSCDIAALKCRIVSDNVSLISNGWEHFWSGNRSREVLFESSCCSGLSIDLLKELMKDLDFEVDLFEVPDRKWGGWTQTEGWNGLVRVLLNHEADLVMTALKITPNRSEQIDFSVPYQRTGISILVALREGAISTKAFLKPYDYPSWCLILVFSVHASGAALFLFEWLSPQGLDRGNVPPREHKFSLFRSLWLIWSMLFGAAVNADNPRGVASRFLGNIWALFALVFLASYTANLAAFMIAEESFYDLAGINDWRLNDPGSHRPPFRFATVPSGATEENVKMNFPHMAKYMQNYNKSNVDEGIKALKNYEIDAFIYDATVLQYRVGKDKDCKLRTVGNWYSMTGYGVGLPKGSKWLGKINQRILTYSKNGQLERWSNFWFTGACQKGGKLRNTNQTLGVKNFISAFILLIGGMLLCCVLLILEHSFYRYMRPRLKEWDKYGCCGLVSISMGQLLSFEQSVNQTVDLIKHHKCRNPICETQLWKVRHELDMARRKVRKLETLLKSGCVAIDDRGDNGDSVVGSEEGGGYLQITNCSQDAIANRLLSQQPQSHNQSANCHQARQQANNQAAHRSRCQSFESTRLLHREPEFNDESLTTPMASPYKPLPPPDIGQLQASPRQLHRRHQSRLTAHRNRQQQQQQQAPQEILYRHPSIRTNNETSIAMPALASAADNDPPQQQQELCVEKESVL